MSRRNVSQKEWLELQEKYSPRDPETYQTPRDKVHFGGRVTNHAFQPWEKDNEVCNFGTCGKLRSQHTDQTTIGAPPKTSEFGKQYWAWLMRHGSVFSVYGPASAETLLILKHLESCSLRDDLAEPSMGEMDEFDGTGSENAHVPAVIGKLQCACGEVTEICDWGHHVNRSYKGGFDTVDWAVKHDDLTLGQVIFQVVNEL